MENPDVSHDENKKDEAIQQNSSNCIYNKSITNNHNEAEALLKNLHDLSSNDSHLKRKRESEILYSMNEKNLMNKNEAGNIVIFHLNKNFKFKFLLKIIKKRRIFEFNIFQN
jgi:hypothetical protein